MDHCLEQMMQGFVAGLVVQHMAPAVGSETPWLVMLPRTRSHFGHSGLMNVSASAAIKFACQLQACSLSGLRLQVSNNTSLYSTSTTDL